MKKIMKKVYIAPLMEQEEMEELLPLCDSRVNGGDVIDADFGGIDEEGELDPS